MRYWRWSERSLDGGTRRTWCCISWQEASERGTRWLVAMGHVLDICLIHSISQATAHHINHCSLDALAYMLNLVPTSPPQPSPSLHELAPRKGEPTVSVISLQELLSHDS